MEEVLAQVERLKGLLVAFIFVQVLVVGVFITLALAPYTELRLDALYLGLFMALPMAALVFYDYRKVLKAQPLSKVPYLLFALVIVLDILASSFSNTGFNVLVLIWVFYVLRLIKDYNASISSYRAALNGLAPMEEDTGH